MNRFLYIGWLHLRVYVVTLQTVWRSKSTTSWRRKSRIGRKATRARDLADQHSINSYPSPNVSLWCMLLYLDLRSLTWVDHSMSIRVPQRTVLLEPLEWTSPPKILPTDLRRSETLNPWVCIWSFPLSTVTSISSVSQQSTYTFPFLNIVLA